MKTERRNFTAREKVGILREHLLERSPVSEVCGKHNLQPTVFYRWQKQFFENGVHFSRLERAYSLGVRNKTGHASATSR